MICSDDVVLYAGGLYERARRGGDVPPDGGTGRAGVSALVHAGASLAGSTHAAHTGGRAVCHTVSIHLLLVQTVHTLYRKPP